MAWSQISQEALPLWISCMCCGWPGDIHAFSGDMEIGQSRLDDRLGVKGMEELAAKCGSWPG